MIETNGSCDISVCFFFSFQGIIQGLENDFNVEKEAPVLQIKNVILYPVYDVAFAINLSTKSTYLGQSCYSRFDEMADHKLIHTFGIHLGVAYHMGARSNDGHFTFKNIDKLRKFIYARFPDNFSDSSDPFISFFDLMKIGHWIGNHRSEFVAIKFFVIQTIPLLFKKYRSFGFQFYQQSQNWSEPRQNANNYK